MPECKARVAWLDRDTLLVGTGLGSGEATASGYPRTIKRWRRGAPLDTAEAYFEGDAKDVAVAASVARCVWAAAAWAAAA